MKVSDLLENEFENNDGKERSFWHQFRFIQRKERSLMHYGQIVGEQKDNTVDKLEDAGHTFSSDDPRCDEENCTRVGITKHGQIVYCLITHETERLVTKLDRLKLKLSLISQSLKKYQNEKEKMKQDRLWNAGREIK